MEQLIIALMKFGLACVLMVFIVNFSFWCIQTIGGFGGFVVFGLGMWALVWVGGMLINGPKK